jgi:hypothetical protein
MAKKPEAPKKPNYKYMRDKDREPVKGIFRFLEVPGGTLSFSFKAYKEDPVENFSLKDGEVYSLPLGVARHINNNMWYPIHSYAQDEHGKHTVKVGQKVHRAMFQSLEFVDIDDMNPPADLVTIEHEPTSPLIL